jgi:glycolate oxidase FAD binding subunit
MDERALVSSLDDATCPIDGAGPFPVVRPGSVTEVGELVRRAAADGQALFPLGGRTMLSVGLPPARPGLGVNLCGLAQVIDYPARDMTITLQAGIGIAQLQALLRGENQRLPVDVPAADRATLGGALAANVSGPRRYGFGTLRDYVIGISTVNDEGHETRAGGRVVKNVAGYDLCKLHIGALGTLGIISQVTLKLRPLPEQTALVALRCGADQLGTLLDQLHDSRTRPVAIDVLNARAARPLPPTAGLPEVREGTWAVIAGFEESGEAVRWQVQQLIKEVSPGKPQGLDVLAGSAAAPLWQALTEFRLYPQAVLTFKANLLPHATADFCRRADALAPAPLLQAHAGNGIVLGHVTGDLPLEGAAALLHELHGLAAASRGNVVVLGCPPTWKATLPVCGLPRGDAALMRAVKDKLDPRGLFNPGRWRFSGNDRQTGVPPDSMER